jgi:hypothetical protein
MAQAALKYATLEEYEQERGATREVETRDETEANTMRSAATVGATAAELEAARYSLSPFAILGTVFIAFLMWFFLMSCAQLTQINTAITGTPGYKPTHRNSVVGLAERLEALTQEAKVLNIEYETAFNLDEIESYAINVLGMVKQPTDQSVSGTQTIREDMAVIIPADTESAGGLRGVLSDIVEYFK